jgi:leader peptidase (prepilin peptidase)/N-methyltransferase
LRWYELVPVLSYLALRGRCGHCSERISLQYPIVELLSGSLVVALLPAYGVSVEFFHAFVFALLMILVALVDWHHLIIPNSVIATGFAAALALKLFQGRTVLLEDAAASAAVFIVLLLFGLAMSALLRKDALGMGDVKLAMLITFFIGWMNFLVALWIAAALGAVFGAMRLRALGKRQTEPALSRAEAEKIPFGSFLAISSLVVLLLGDLISQWMEPWLT